MCPWTHEVWTDEDTGRRFCVEVCQSCGDTDSCTEDGHQRWSQQDEDVTFP